jgi:hypothetical protein
MLNWQNLQNSRTEDQANGQEAEETHETEAGMQMSEEAITQHKRMAMGDMPEVSGVETPWKPVAGPKGSRELSDGQRKPPKAPWGS